MQRHLIGDTLEKSVRLNPYKRITRGEVYKVNVDNVEVEVISDKAGKYTYLQVDGVDSYVSAKLTEGADYQAVDVLTKAEAKAAQAETAETAEAGEAGEAGEAVEA